MDQLYKDLIQRTGGDIYLGVVGPVRTGKSTFIKKFMELFVIPEIKDDLELERATDQLPQSGTGKMVMTTEPKFIPEDAIEIDLTDNTSMRVRLVDCVGYMINGAQGYEDEEGPRMVMTPWFEEPVPFAEAAEIGTEKVMREHSTIGVVITTDGSIVDIERENYIAAEEKIINEMQRIQKPFVVILNTQNPNSEETEVLQQELAEKYAVSIIPVDVSNMGNEEMYKILQEVLYEFPLQEINITMPDWLEKLPKKHWLSKKIHEHVSTSSYGANTVRDILSLTEKLLSIDYISEVILEKLQLGEGIADIKIVMPQELFMQILKEITGLDLTTIDDLIPHLYGYVEAKNEYDMIKEALMSARKMGYGVVPPKMLEMILEEPEIIRQGNRFGVRLKASAPSYHIVKVDVESEVAPIIGSERQSEELIKYLLDEFEASPERLWESNIFGKSLQTLVEEGIQKKLFNMPENARDKLREALEKIINEGNGGLIAIIL
ncbi:stage IV sporulation protein A [Clostridium sp. 'deep sea']|uniref:stage IV sporulation protein A n=1 Tax=Clostridium sp. 'deep sea' TaxID=2779445 RepID=UPI001896850C|nr:stage IV sporulation protein A [Clostridium sp. 'deep sea']QOR35804.1 stage IV sporulation protein A [Clostridium sp. 'deep sea']